MWVRLAVGLCCLVLGCQGQGRTASLRKANDDFTGRCQYTFTVDSPAESSCPQAGAGGPEDEGVRTRLTLLEALVSRLMGERGGVVGEAGLRTAEEEEEVEEEEVGQLQQDKERLSRQVQDLQRRLEELTLETEQLRQRPCHQPQPPRLSTPDNDPAFQLGSGAFQEMKAELSEVPAPPQIQQGQNQAITSTKAQTTSSFTGCGVLVSVQPPVTHRKADSITGKYGAWFQDPEPLGQPYGPKTVWRIDAVGKEVKQLFAYEDMEQLIRGFPMKVLPLPEAVESTGATVYRGSLYYQRRLSRMLIRYDVATESVAARMDLPHAGFHGQHPYSWGGYTDIDLAVDERGLWAIYSTSKAKGAIVIAKLDPESLEVTKTWETNIRKNTVANGFMVCGRLYTVASYSLPNTTISYMFDTDTNQSSAISIPFHNRYHYNSMIDYNPGNKKLYAWDNYHMVTYDVKLAQSDSIP
ncbi:myocilin-like isoform X1 [Alosa pseudoharengus]|uniref:myocilin-like isoform X1 n=1 Tax=Alosa pseudoharengus TaxID=34774 RepID=UPI003F88DE1F